MFPYDQPNSAQAIQKDNSSSNLSGNSRTMSINNTSQDTSHRVDSNTSGRRNGSSKANTKSRLSFQKTVNEDISLIEKIDALLNQITLNHNKVCPFCGKCKKLTVLFILFSLSYQYKEMQFPEY